MLRLLGPWGRCEIIIKKSENYYLNKRRYIMDNLMWVFLQSGFVKQKKLVVMVKQKESFRQTDTNALSFYPLDKRGKVSKFSSLFVYSTSQIVQGLQTIGASLRSKKNTLKCELNLQEGGRRPIFLNSSWVIKDIN